MSDAGLTWPLFDTVRCPLFVLEGAYEIESFRTFVWYQDAVHSGPYIYIYIYNEVKIIFLGFSILC